MPKYRVTVYDRKNPKNEGISVHEVEGANEVAMLDALSLVVPWDELICVKEITDKALLAAQEFAKWLKENGHGDAQVWTKADVQKYGWGSGRADAGVCLEGSVRLAEMQIWERGWFKGGMQPVAGVFAEPYSEWLMYFYNEE